MAESACITDSPRERIHTVAFEDPHQAVHAAALFRARGFDVPDAHTPFAVHGMEEALGFAESRLPWATFFGGLCGLALGMGFQLWTHVVDWPLNIGGKSFLAWQALVPVGFEVIVLLAAFGTVGALLYLGGLVPGRGATTPVQQPGPRVTDDRFVLLVAEKDASFSWDAFEAVCEEVKPVEVVEAWRVL